MVHSWLHEVSTYENMNADAQLMHFYRYLKNLIKVVVIAHVTETSGLR